MEEKDLSSSIGKIISRGLERSDLVGEFEKNKELIVKAVQLNLREVKRFINDVILLKSVIIIIDKPIDRSIAVQALTQRDDWSTFLELITSDETRKEFLIEYEKLKDRLKLKQTTTDEELDNFSKDLSDDDQHSINENLRRIHSS